ncbi:MAG: hypothetical protein WKG07_48725 [Hymenobacter sp.]
MGHVYADGQARADSSQTASYRRYLRQLYRTLPAEEGQVYNAAGRLVFREGQRTAGGSARRLAAPGTPPGPDGTGAGA